MRAAPFLEFEGLLTYPASQAIGPFVDRARELFERPVAARGKR